MIDPIYQRPQEADMGLRHVETAIDECNREIEDRGNADRPFFEERRRHAVARLAELRAEERVARRAHQKKYSEFVRMQKRIRGLENALADRSAHQARYLGFIDDIGEALGVYGLPRAICGKIRDDAEILRTMVTAKHEEAERQASGSK